MLASCCWRVVIHTGGAPKHRVVSLIKASILALMMPSEADMLIDPGRAWPAPAAAVNACAACRRGSARAGRSTPSQRPAARSRASLMAAKPARGSKED
jgi:hypothetical protein